MLGGRRRRVRSGRRIIKLDEEAKNDDKGDCGDGRINERLI